MSGFAEKVKGFIQKPQNCLELAADILCLVASYGLLFLAPDNVNILFWVLFALSAFLFCIGFFRLGFIIDPPKTKKGMIISGSLLVTFGIALNCIGICTVFISYGSGCSIAIAVLLLIEAILMYSITSSHANMIKWYLENGNIVWSTKLDKKKAKLELTGMSLDKFIVEADLFPKQVQQKNIFNAV